jgi:hypothetical protein
MKLFRPAIFKFRAAGAKKTKAWNSHPPDERCEI